MMIAFLLSAVACRIPFRNMTFAFSALVELAVFANEALARVLDDWLSFVDVFVEDESEELDRHCSVEESLSGAALAVVFGGG